MTAHLDYSTLVWSKIRTYPTLTSILPKHGKNWHRGQHMGQGCHLDAPGFPSYFLESIYNSRGDDAFEDHPAWIFEPHGNEAYSILGGKESWGLTFAQRTQKLKELWNPLPYDHLRVRIWQTHCYMHWRNCYVDLSLPEDVRQHAEKLIFWPMTGFNLPLFYLPSLHLYKTDEEYLAEVKTNLQKAFADTRDILWRATNVAGQPFQHAAYQYIKRFYPEATPQRALIEWKGYRFQEDWYERWSEQPAPEQCPGHLGTRHGALDNCRFCGRTEGVKKERASK